ncbi:hypothetical protein Tco_0976241 [Tanacetum coccineum]|uniref:Tf2-1-like SH3-like domain-containing protein n=1 Tax=Tanacetum coccineum TaxID=301880 RepID=A0ABQ5EGV2_9ASTR
MDEIPWISLLVCLYSRKDMMRFWGYLDRLTSCSFLPIQRTMNQQFTSSFLKGLQKAWGTRLKSSFIGPFEILERIGEVSYRLALPPQLSHVHDVFHVSLLRGYHYHPLHVASYPFDQIQPDMSLSEEPESILDRQEKS